MRILTEQQERILNRERELLTNLRVALATFEATEADQAVLAQSLQQLDDLFLLVIVGEFNAGKSAFINALLGQRLLKEGVTPTTTEIQILRYGDTSSRTVTDRNIQLVTLPAELLREVSIVDTPGTNAVIREHEEITSEFVPRSDLVLFITSADRPFTESERAFLERIRDWGKKVVLIINKIDLFQDEHEMRQVLQFVQENARALLGVTPELFPLSARLALRAKLGEPQHWETSRFAALEQYIQDTLDEAGRIRLKLMNPLGVARHLADKHLQVIQSRLDLLREDFAAITDVDQQLALYQEDMQRDFNFRLADIGNILFEMQQRGDEFFEETFRIGRIFDLLARDRIQQEFEHKVVADVPQRIEAKVSELIDWLVGADLRQWQAVHEHIGQRRRVYQERIVGETSIGAFHYDRERVMDAIGREARRVVETYDKTREAQSIADGAQAAIAASLAVEAGAVGLGALVTILATTAAADVTGVLLAGVVAALGLFILPAKRRQAKNQMSEKVADMRERLVSALRSHFEREIERSTQHIQETIAPYTRFVRGERDKLTQTQQQLEAIAQPLEDLQRQVSEI